MSTSLLQWLMLLLSASLLLSRFSFPAVSIQDSPSFVFSRRDLGKVSDWRNRATVDSDSAEIVIGLSTLSQLTETLSALTILKGVKLVQSLIIGEQGAIVVDVSLENLPYFISQIQTLNFVTYVEPNWKLHVSLTPNDPEWNLQWAPLKIQADWAWNTTFGSSSLLVGIVDTGVDWNHPDLAANYLPLGYDWVNNDSDPADDNGHGTHVAGIIAAVINNNEGVAGLAQVKFMMEKSFNSTGWADEVDAANGVVHAVDQGAKIISMSWGDYNESALIRTAIDYAYSSGVLLVAAAGNDRSSDMMYPAAYNEVIAVTATDKNDQPATFTNHGSWVELAAPGVDIYSTFPNDDYTYLSGTSMAAPHVTGVAALVWSRFPNMTRDQVRMRLRETADDPFMHGFDDYYGYGRVNARKALMNFAHDLSITLEAPNSVLLGKSAKLNLTVSNSGEYTEGNISVQVSINGSVTFSETLSTLNVSGIGKLNFTWSPSRGRFNVTAYVLPVDGEENIGNNRVSRYVVAQPSLIYPIADSYANYHVDTYQNTTLQRGELNFTYTEILADQFIMTRMDSANVLGMVNGTFWLEVDSVTKLVQSGPLTWVDIYYFGLSETTISWGDTVDLFVGKGYIVGDHDLTIGNRTYSTWLVGYSGATLPFNMFPNHYLYFDKATGLLVKWVSTSVAASLESSFPFTMVLTETNMDATLPSITIISPQQGSIVGKTSLSVEWVGGDNETGIDKYSVYLNQVFIANTTQMSYLFTNLPEGLNTVEVVAFDKAGNSASSKVTVKVDITPPTVRILSPISGFITNMTSVDVEWSGEDSQTALVNYTLYANEAFAASTTSTTSTTFILTDLSEGENILVLVASDLADNEANATITFVVDWTAPDISISAPQEDSVVFGVVLVSFEVSSDVTQVFLYIDSASVNVTGLSSYQWNTVQLGDGEYAVKVVAFDRAGNIGEKTIMLTLANGGASDFQKFLYFLGVVSIIAVIALSSAWLFKRSRQVETRLETSL